MKALTLLTLASLGLSAFHINQAHACSYLEGGIGYPIDGAEDIPTIGIIEHYERSLMAQEIELMDEHGTLIPLKAVQDTIMPSQTGILQTEQKLEPHTTYTLTAPGGGFNPQAIHFTTGAGEDTTPPMAAKFTSSEVTYYDDNEMVMFQNGAACTPQKVPFSELSVREQEWSMNERLPAHYEIDLRVQLDTRTDDRGTLRLYKLLKGSRTLIEEGDYRGSTGHLLVDLPASSGGIHHYALEAEDRFGNVSPCLLAIEIEYQGHQSTLTHLDACGEESLIDKTHFTNTNGGEKTNENESQSGTGPQFPNPEEPTPVCGTTGITPLGPVAKNTVAESNTAGCALNPSLSSPRESSAAFLVLFFTGTLFLIRHSVMQAKKDSSF